MSRRNRHRHTGAGEIKPVVTIVTDNGGPFRSFRLEAFIASHPEIAHVRTRVKSPARTGHVNAASAHWKYERLFIDEMDDAVMLAQHAKEYRIKYNQIRSQEAIAWNRSKEVHLGLADPSIPTFQAQLSVSREKNCPPTGRFPRQLHLLTSDLRLSGRVSVQWVNRVNKAI